MKALLAALMTLALTACVSTDSLQLSNGDGKNYRVSGRTYEQIWQAATTAMSTDMHIVESHKPSGVIKSRVTNGTAGKVVGFFIQPTSPDAPIYTVTIVSRKPLQSPVDRDGEPSVWDDFQRVLGRAR